MIRNLIDTIVRDIRNDDSKIGGCPEVDRINSHSIPCNDLAFWKIFENPTGQKGILVHKPVRLFAYLDQILLFLDLSQNEFGTHSTQLFLLLFNGTMVTICNHYMIWVLSH